MTDGGASEQLEELTDLLRSIDSPGSDRMSAESMDAVYTSPSCVC